jgi:predicted SnoaL-like aldol condensation-catalyzing enzyme
MTAPRTKRPLSRLSAKAPQRSHPLKKNSPYAQACSALDTAVGPMYLAAMKTPLALLFSLAVWLTCLPAVAQEPVIGVTGAEADALFTSKDPQLNINKQAAYHIMKDLLEANHWELADQWLTPAYHQHNPNVASGRDDVVKFFMSIRKPSEIPEHLTKTRIVAVVAEGDLVVVVTPRELTDPRDPTKKYTTSWFDMWRFNDGKADEHWDGATINPPPKAAN